ncbi:MAG TPA: SDR family NAD(P)-dependent oxidoreductase [Polyangiales bacterium]|nr:SDR family NAD(P)-dependent oxidoreductase [Polyangiales bacterium]
MRDLKGRNAIVTGASRGLGVHIARGLAAEGVNLVLIARSSDAISSLAQELGQSGIKALPLAADLADTTGLDAVIERAEAELGPIDILVNNAGIDGIRIFADESAAQTEQMVRTNLLSPMLLTHKLLPRLLARKSGHVVNIASLAGKSSAPYSVSYSSAKAGLVAFSHCLRNELQGTGVSVSVICPGFVTDAGMFFASAIRKHGARVSPLLGTSKPEHVARAVLRALRNDSIELPVNPGPIRIIMALNQLAPSMVSWAQDRLFGVNAMMRNVALADRNR